MAIISCPFCQHQISDKSKLSNQCDDDIGAMSNEQIASKHRVLKIKKNQSIQVQTFMALLLFVGGFSLWYWEDKPGESWLSLGGQGLIVVGFIWYIVNRARLIFNKRR